MTELPSTCLRDVSAGCSYLYRDDSCQWERGFNASVKTNPYDLLRHPIAAIRYSWQAGEARRAAFERAVANGGLIGAISQ
jgi:hypothetical protein